MSDAPTKAEVERLEKEAEDAERALRKARQMRDDEKDQLLSAARERIVREVDGKHNEKIQQLCAASVAAAKAATKAKEQRALSGATSQIPLGTRMVHWERVRGLSSAWEQKPSGKKGIVEVLTTGSPLPDNKRYGLPKPGDVIIRFLKKDGSKALGCIDVDSWDAKSHWLPEGQKPKEGK
jgi:hypothetical protein